MKIKIKQLELRIPNGLTGRANLISRLLEENINNLVVNCHKHPKKELLLRVENINQAMSNQQIVDQIIRMLTNHFR